MGSFQKIENLFAWALKELEAKRRAFTQLAEEPELVLTGLSPLQ